MCGGAVLVEHAPPLPPGSHGRGGQRAIRDPPPPLLRSSHPMATDDGGILTNGQWRPHGRTDVHTKSSAPACTTARPDTHAEWARDAGLVWVRSRHPAGLPLLSKEHRCSRTCTTRQKPRVPVRAAVNPAGGRRLRGARCSMREARAAVTAVTVKEGQQSSATVAATHASSPAPVWGKSVGGPSTSGATTKTATDDDVSVRGC